MFIVMAACGTIAKNSRAAQAQSLQRLCDVGTLATK